MIGLPDSVWACLFDLDGVMTHTATVHAAVWRLGSRKNELVLRMIREEGVEAYDGSVRYLEAARHERVLDLRAGVLRRRAERVYPAGQAVLVSSVRLVSLTQRDRGHSALHAVKPQQACGAPGRSLD